MNKKTLYWVTGIIIIAVLAILFFNGLNGKTTNAGGLEEYMTQQDAAMQTMMTDMENISPAGDAGIDFLAGMIPHHKSAVAMAESYLQYGGKHDELKALAKDIIQVQEEEITQMNTMMEQLQQFIVPDLENEERYLEEYNKMFSNDMMHHAGHSDMYQNVNEAFAEGMIMHHEMAVDMSELILNYTDHEEIITLAQGIIDAQNKEIKEMNDILKELK